MNTDNFNIEDELGCVYVQACRELFDEEEVSKEKLITAIKYLNALSGGIAAHRKSTSLMDALEHIDCMSSRLDDSGLPRDYLYEELRHLMVEETGYLPEDFDRVLEKFRETKDFLPSPKEFIEFHEKMKGIVHLEKKVEETTQAFERSQREAEKTTQEKDQTIQEKDQALKERDQTIQEKDQALQEKDRIIQQERQQSEQKDRLLQQERERLRELEQTPEGEFQKQLHELEEKNQELKDENQELKEENRELKEKNREKEEENQRLSAMSQLALCKVCLIQEVQVLFIPCNHLISCHQCAQSLNKKCPLCRKSVEGTVRVYL